MPVLRFLQSALWSYDLSRMDAKRDASMIITQIFNHGTWRQIQWVLKTYSSRTIKKYIQHPSRGMWHKDAMTYWSTIYEVCPRPMDYKRALFSLVPTNLPLPKKRWRTSKRCESFS